MYQYITKYDSPNFGYPDSARGQNRPRRIIIHHWGSDGQRFENVINWLCNSRAQASAHYVVEAGRVACIVDLSNAAWHAGNKNDNTSSIGIECRPECTTRDMQTVAELIASIWKQYGKLPIIGHKDVASTACPGRYYSRLSELRTMAEKVYRGEPLVKPQPKPPKPVFYYVKKKWSDTATNKFDTEKKAIDYAMNKIGYSVFDNKGNEKWRNNMNKINETVDFKTVGTLKVKKIWENLDYTKDFIAQKINLNFENAEKIFIEFSPSKGGDTTEYKVVDLNKSAYLQHISKSDINDIPELRARRVTATKDGIVFGNGYGRSITNETNYVKNNYNIPIAVYLMKGFN